MKLTIRALTALTLAVLTAPLPAEAQQTGASNESARVGMLWPGPTPPPPPRMGAVEQGLRESGYNEGQNLTVDLRFAAKGATTIPDLAAQLVGLEPSVIMTIGDPATRAVQQKTKSAPIVALADDLVGVGLVDNLARPGGNTTGVQILAPELSAKRLELLKQLVPGLSRVAVLADPDNSGSQLPPLREAAQSLGITLQMLEVRSKDDIEKAITAASSEHAGALNVLASPMLFAQSKLIVELTAKYKLPAIHQWREAVEAGGLISYGPVLAEMWRQTALLVGRVLKGQKPAQLPVEEPSRYELVINLKAAQALELQIPEAIRLRADAVIQ